MAGLWILSFILSLKSTLLKERSWVICSPGSLKKSDLPTVTLKEWPVSLCVKLVFLEQITLSQSKIKQSAQQNSLFSPCFWQFFTVFPIFMPKSEALPWLCCSFLKSDHEQFVPVTLNIWYTCKSKGSDLLLEKSEYSNYFALWLTKNEQFAWKTHFCFNYRWQWRTPGNQGLPRMPYRCYCRNIKVIQDVTALQWLYIGFNNANHLPLVCTAKVNILHKYRKHYTVNLHANGLSLLE